MAQQPKFKILFENAQVVVVDKPAGVLSVPGRDLSQPNISDLLKAKRDNLWPVHRIDKHTSGVLLFAKNAEVHRELSAQFEARTVVKHYEAIVQGRPPDDHGVIDLALSVDSRGLAKPDPKGKPSQTEYRVVEKYDGFAHLLLRPLTGRQHQIRIHLKALGCPLVVDPQYGMASHITIADIKRHMRKDVATLYPLLARTPLHASELTVVLPGGEMTFSAHLPKDMRATLSQLAKWRKTSQR